MFVIVVAKKALVTDRLRFFSFKDLRWIDTPVEAIIDDNELTYNDDTIIIKTVAILALQ